MRKACAASGDQRTTWRKRGPPIPCFLAELSHQATHQLNEATWVGTYWESDSVKFGRSYHRLLWMTIRQQSKCTQHEQHEYNEYNLKCHAERKKAIQHEIHVMLFMWMKYPNSKTKPSPLPCFYIPKNTHTVLKKM